ncbi:Uncharacterized conserved protein, contains FHA domain [Citrobacter freundii]|nr:Uncharacterized conserved protein, contains FHA domain [Citrobacter freundii]
MRFRIISTKAGHHPPQDSFDFYAPGGTIGRSTDNNLVLPDDDRTISRLQAIVHVAVDGECQITNRGNVTRVILNGIPLERSRQVELQDGDILSIDEYRIEVSNLVQDNPPFSSESASGHSSGTSKPRTLPPAEATPTTVPSEIWDSLMQEFSISDSLSVKRNKQQADTIPHPFIDSGAPERNPEDPLTMFPNSKPLFEHPPVETDKLFADDSPLNGESIFADATPTILRQPVSVKPEDGLGLPGLMDGVPLTTAEASVSGETTEVQNPFPSQTKQVSGHHVVHMPKGRLCIDPLHNKARAASGPKPGHGEVLQNDLLEALLEGMGLEDMQPVPQFDRENMHQLGQILSIFSQGTVALLSSRSILKRDVKADMTMVLDDANNPFKLLPSGKTVLMQMFGTKMPGFMSPKKSVRDALIDLQAHQLGMISGINALVASILQSFNPEQLQEKAKQDGAATRLMLPASRKAILWDYYVRTYNETAGKSGGDFHSLSGETFLDAYSMEVNYYKDSQSGTEE